MKQYFAYVRVSTQRQGEHGSSLQEQRAAIEAFAQREHLTIIEWFEERETAAKIGRTVFRRMFALLDKGKAHGVIMHKIDRGARNLSDWADLAKLLDKGIEVRFANDNLDMTSRGGRLAADIQAVVAADYIRNLREEVIKGLYGRLKQGFYPRNAPIGYLDNGAAKAKTICPKVGPQIRRVFELYATGNYSILSLADELMRLGVRSRRGRVLGPSSLGLILSNHFYYGLMKIKRNGQSFVGNHEPLISKVLFDRVQAIKCEQIKVKTGIRHSYVLQRMIRCAKCSRSLSAEKQKGRVYYRCHTRTCLGTSVREDQAIEKIGLEFRNANIDARVLSRMNDALRDILDDLQVDTARTARNLKAMLAQLRDKDARLVDAYLERAIDKATLDERRTTLNIERIGVEESIEELNNPEELAQRGTTFLELLKALELIDKSSNPSEIREICRIAISNFVTHRKNLAIAWSFPFSQLFFGSMIHSSGPDPRESLRSGSVHHRETPTESVWTEERIREVLRTVILGKPQELPVDLNNIPSSPRLAELYP